VITKKKKSLPPAVQDVTAIKLPELKIKLPRRASRKFGALLVLLPSGQRFH
jgi:hypothetical protein